MLEENKLSNREKFTLAVLCFIYALNYCDQGLAASLFHHVQKYFSITEDDTKYYCVAQYTAASFIAPAYGYLGDRYSRRRLLMISLGIGSISHLISSFAINYPMLVVFRLFVGIGVSGLRVIGPVVIASIVSYETRVVILSIFYICLMLGRGFGVIVGSLIADIIGCWWTLRVTTVFSFISIVLLYFGVYPKSGAKQAALAGKEAIKATPYGQDLHHLLTNISFLIILIANISVNFVSGTLWWCGGDYLFMGLRIVFEKAPGTITQVQADIDFESILTVTAITGVMVGTTLTYYQRRIYPAADTVICGICLIVSWPFLTVALYTCGTNKYGAYFFFFVGETFLYANIALLIDMVLYVLTPMRHGTGLGVLVFTGFVFGEMISPFILQYLTHYYESLAKTPNNWIHFQAQQESSGNVTTSGIVEFRALQMSLFTFLLFQLFAAVCFLVNKKFIVKYHQKAEETMYG